jgi:pimeloyl-ACP methyl ester carboxylesterase
MRDRIEVVEGVPLQQFEPDWLGARIAQNTLVIHDEADRVSPLASSHRIVRALANAALHTTQGLSHTRLLGDPAVSVNVLRHLL